LPAKQLANFVQHALTVQPLVGDTVLTWDSVSGWPPVGDFSLRLDNPALTISELVRVTSVNVGANQTTVVRAQEGTSASGSFVIGSTGGNDLTAQTLTDAMLRLDTSLSQTLTGPLSIPTALGGSPAATSYGTVPLKFAETLLGAPAASVSFTSIPATFRNLSWAGYVRGDTSAVNQTVFWRLNNDSAANYDTEQNNFFGTTTSVPAEALATASPVVATMPAATATANYFGTFHGRLHQYAGTTGNKIWTAESAEARSNATSNQIRTIWMGKWRTTATAVNRVDFFPGANNFATGSYFGILLEP
jgi:hypothetical protein